MLRAYPHLSELALLYTATATAMAGAYLCARCQLRHYLRLPLLALVTFLIAAVLWTILRTMWFPRVAPHANTRLMVLAEVFYFVAAGTLVGFAGSGPRRDAKLKRGTEIRDRSQITIVTTRARRSNAITLAGIPLNVMDETKHFKLIGSTGTGKSTAIREILQSALARGDRADYRRPRRQLSRSLF